MNDVTPGLVLRALSRSWPVVILGLILTGVAVLHVATPVPLYRTVTEVQFSAPPGTPQGGDLSQDLVSFAAVVERAYNAGVPVSSLSSTTAPLNGTGVREGVSVQLRNSGGQWVTSFRLPHLTVEVVAASEDRLLELHASTVKKILATARELQFGRNVPEVMMAVAVEDPVQPEISYVGSRRSGQVRAVAAMVIVGMGLTTFAAATVDRYRSRQRLADIGDSALLRASRRGEPMQT